MSKRRSPVPSLSWEEFVDDVQGAVWNQIQSGTLIQDISGDTRLSQTTISRFASRETRNPSTRTVFLLAAFALDMRVSLIPNSIPVQKYEVAMRKFRALGPRRK